MHIDYSTEPAKIALTLIEDIRHRLDDSEKGLAELLLNPVPSALANEQDGIRGLLERHRIITDEIDVPLHELSEVLQLWISLMEEL